MGLGLFSTCAAVSTCSVDGLAPRPVNNPNPRNFKILRTDEQAHATVVEIVYPDAKNYEGRKILVYLHPLATITAQRVLDPHFCDDRTHLSPFARFEPTATGWEVACALAAVIRP